MTDPRAASELAAALLAPECYPHAAAGVELVETHISWVLLAGDYAYKVKKPVNLGFVDFSTLEARRQYCEEELRLNRRFAPGLYLEVVEIRGPAHAPRISGAGPLLDYAVKMRRFSQDALAKRLLVRGELTPQLVSGFAGWLARFHESLPPQAGAREHGSPQAVLANALQNFDQIAPLVRAPEDTLALAALREWTLREFEARRAEFGARHAASSIRECHGDLHLGNIVLEEGRLVAFDCIEFNAALRWNDVMSEVAFLVMDLVDRGAPQLAWLALNAYLEESGAYPGLAVLRFYVVYRALVRAKIHLMRAREPGMSEQEAARIEAAFRGYLALAAAWSTPGAPQLVLMHGYSASGKSAIALELAQACGAIRVRSDVERKRLHGLAANARSHSEVGDGLYSAQATEATYARLAQAARAIVGAGYTAIADAAFLRRAERAPLIEVAAALAAPALLIDVQAPAELLEQRIASRAKDAHEPSEASIEVLAHQAAQAQPVEPDERLQVLTVDGRDALAPQAMRELARRIETAASVALRR